MRQPLCCCLAGTQVSVVHRQYIINSLRILTEIASVLLAALIAYRLHLNLAATSLLQLLVVLTVALHVGFWQSTFVSVLAFCCLDFFFIPPVFALNVSDPQNWVSLLVFEISAVIVSRLSSEAKRQAVVASGRRAELEQLYDISRQLLLLGHEQSLGRQILTLIQKVFAIKTAVLFDASTSAIELLGDDAASLASDTRGAYLDGRDSRTSDGQTWLCVLRLGVRPIGALALQGGNISGATANALASLTATTLERAHSLERETRAQAERQSEQLRTTVLDALAHEYKSPLTAIRAATSGLLEMGQLSSSQAELITLIDSETRRLTTLTTRLLQMSRLDTADIRLRPTNIVADELISALLSSSGVLLSGHPVVVHGSDGHARLRADRELVLMALTQFVDNAAKYSDPASPITISVTILPGAVRLSVHNFGPAIPPADRDRIFERFYRSAGSIHKAAGTGIGLSIAKKVADAHGGRVGVDGNAGEGNTFFLELPASKRSNHD